VEIIIKNIILKRRKEDKNLYNCLNKMYNKYFIIILFFSMSICCSTRISHNDIIRIHSNLSSADLADYDGWNVFRRTKNIVVFNYYYEHNDSSKYDFINDSTILPMSKYQAIAFAINKEFDSLFYYNENATISFSDGLNILANHSGHKIEIVEKEIRNIYKAYTQNNIIEITCYPWTKIYSFKLDFNTKLIKINDSVKINWLKKDGYVNLTGKWFYKNTPR